MRRAADHAQHRPWACGEVWRSNLIGLIGATLAQLFQNEVGVEPDKARKN